MFCTLPCFSKYINYSRIDRYAKNAPILKNNENLDKLVEYLVYPYSKDEEKARVILAWIVYYIDYDDYVYHRIEEHNEAKERRFGVKKEVNIPENEILEIRAGVCGDIASLYQKMGRMAGLEVEVVNGNISNDCSFERLERGSCAHAWNAVKIDGEWEFVDPTWAMGNARELGNIDSFRVYNKELEKRKKGRRNYKPRRERLIHNEWFLPDKDFLIRTHLPNDEKWQLQKKKITNAEFVGMHEMDYNTYKKARERIKRRHEESEAYKERSRQQANKR